MTRRTANRLPPPRGECQVGPFTPTGRPLVGSLRRLIATPGLRHLLIVAAVGAHASTRALVVCAEASSAQARPAPDALTAIETPALSANPVARIPLDRLSVTRERPLFLPSRRPPSRRDPPAVARVEQATPPQTPVAPPAVALFGIVVGDDGARAFITAGPAHRIVRVRPGDDVDGWRVSAITERRLVLSRSDLSATFTLFSPENASRTGPSELPQPTPVLTSPRVRIR
jgi:hypothetical protein